MIGGEEPALEGDGEGGEGGLPSVHPAVGSFAGGVEGPHDKVEAVHGGLLGWEVPSCSGRSSHAAWRLSMRSEEHTYELQSLMRISYAAFCLNTQKIITNVATHINHHPK